MVEFKLNIMPFSAADTVYMPQKHLITGFFYLSVFFSMKQAQLSIFARIFPDFVKFKDLKLIFLFVKIRGNSVIRARCLECDLFNC